ncbi:formate--tetrahydrofolate ligase [Lactococcus formosensis]|uniref:Formate--tetrahydrofolate ligase n=1 Tax=Lactococcus formosensis TaxID=1281486 RepID=A0A9X4NWL0_9LACT|nr:formate--tetrahydrofolate ligase [Lactococcus formosensis]MDG6126357.1 formate--tetrahydrofolate ligase [Lactococcus formosensis]MDG6131955.1 formate--tetrahydrofolate ligase [Lactococcus formosensis]MDG6133952.1 formate--tetrahydrofolate ligase [Lactococcus formosensis]MDG6140422.1 formate--tetrahydrofolate ligase [Lactococcus formosensis]MDG6144964.1 formate--tetrahydrofolate ligase [Lactococcus formosensis]
MKTDIEIAQECKMEAITDVAEKIGLSFEDIELYGKYKAKIPLESLKKFEDNAEGKLVLVTSINPTPAGEGKSTVTVGLADAFARLNQKVMVALREPSLGPVMGIKGGATGGGYAQVLPMEDINLHFTGDIHAMTTANNAIAALLDNHIFQGNALNIDSRRVVWKRVLDMNDRELRHIVAGLGSVVNGVPREDGFDITVASEIMAVLCLATSLTDLKERLSRIVVAYTYDRQPVTVGDLEIEGAITVLLKDALKPNLAQTIEGTPVLVHGGPFANIAHGCNSVLATKTALKLADVTITEAGFGADLGGEKFLDIKTRQLGKTPDTIVIVATLRALKMHGGVAKTELTGENVAAVTQGFANLKRHIKNMVSYGAPIVVAINQFASDTEAEIAELTRLVKAEGVAVSLTQVFEKGGAGGIDLAEKLTSIFTQEAREFHYLYDLEASVESKITTVVTQIYGGKKVNFSAKAARQLKEIEENGWDKLPVCMAKTQYSFSDNPKLLAAPEGFEVTVRELVPKIGAGFIVALLGDVMTMPGLPKKPAALNMDINEAGKITGLF